MVQTAKRVAVKAVNSNKSLGHFICLGLFLLVLDGTLCYDEVKICCCSFCGIVWDMDLFCV